MAQSRHRIPEEERTGNELPETDDWVQQDENFHHLRGNTGEITELGWEETKRTGKIFSFCYLFLENEQIYQSGSPPWHNVNGDHLPVFPLFSVNSPYMYILTPSSGK